MVRHLLAAAVISCAGQFAAGADFFPAAGATSVNPDTPLRIRFDGPVALAGGKIRITEAGGGVVEEIDASSPVKTGTIGGMNNYKYYALRVDGSEAEIKLGKPLEYGKTYQVVADADAFRPGQALSWSFSTKRVPPAAIAPTGGKLTVAPDSSGDFSTVQGALDFIPAGSRVPVTILLKPGTYREMIYFTQKHNITILGEDRKTCVIAYPTNANFNPQGSPYRRGVFLAQRVEDLVVGNLTIRNTTPQGGSQAEAIILAGTTSARAIVAGVDLYSFQDTLQINGQAYVSDCYIEGDVDFMWGSGPTFFQNCDIKSLRSNAYYTQIRNPPTNHGYVYVNCQFRGAENVRGNVLSRIDPVRFPASEVVLIDCMVMDAVGPVAWRFDNFAAGGPTPDIHFWEYNSRDAAGQPVNAGGRFPASKQLKIPEDAATIANYRDAKWVLGNEWQPRLAPIIASAPKNITAKADEKVVLSVQAVGVPAVTYQWKKNGLIANEKGPTLTMETASAGTYTVRVRNEAGEASAEVVVKVE